MSRKILPAAKGGKKKSDKDDKPVTYVRGGSICTPGVGGAHLIRGTGHAAVCRNTPGKDTRPRWRAAGK